MTTKQTKPKAWRGKLWTDDGDREIVLNGWPKTMHDCTVTPDGAPMPQDVATRLLVKAALAWQASMNRRYRNTMMPKEDELMMDACAEYQKAKAGKGEG